MVDSMSFSMIPVIIMIGSQKPNQQHPPYFREKSEAAACISKAPTAASAQQDPQLPCSFTKLLEFSRLRL